MTNLPGKSLKILLDGSQLSTGGGVQVYLSMLDQIGKENSHTWYLCVSPQVAREVKEHHRTAAARLMEMPQVVGARQKIRNIQEKLPAFEAECAPDMVFTVFGPAYWRSNAPHLVGFALPKLIYPLSQWAHSISLLGKGIEFAKGALKGRWVKDADAWVVETETVKARLCNRFGLPVDRVHVVRNSYSPAFEKRIGEGHTRPSKRRWVFLVPSSYYPHKNLEAVPSVARQLLEQGVEDFEFWMTLPKDGAPWQRIAGMAQKLKVDDHIESTGFVRNEVFADLYNSCSAVFLPTLLECSTAVYPESFLARKPLVTTDLDFARELCGDGALFFSPFDPNDAAEKLKRVIFEEKMRQSLIEHGQKVLGDHYPDPEQKWKDQLNLMESFAARGR